MLDQSTVGDSNYGSTNTFLQYKIMNKELGNKRMIHTSFPGKRFIKQQYENSAKKSEAEPQPLISMMELN